MGGYANAFIMNVNKALIEQRMPPSRLTLSKGIFSMKRIYERLIRVMEQKTIEFHFPFFHSTVVKHQTHQNKTT